MSIQRRACAAVALVAAAGALVVLPVAAQTRHDDKPHGQAKPIERRAGHPAPHTSGRHMDMPHGSSQASRTLPAGNDSTAPGTSTAPGGGGSASAGSGSQNAEAASPKRP